MRIAPFMRARVCVFAPRWVGLLVAGLGRWVWVGLCVFFLRRFFRELWVVISGSIVWATPAVPPGAMAFPRRAAFLW